MPDGLKRAAPRRAGSGRSSSPASSPASSTPPRTTARPNRPRVGAFLRILLVWIVGSWSVVGALLAPVVPGGWLAIAGAIVLTTSPLALFLAVRRGRGSSPGAAFRLLVMRPFWYVQLLLPLLAIAGLAGTLAGLPWGNAGVAGRGALYAMAAIFAVAAVAGWVGSRQLVVKQLVVRSPDLPPGFDGLRIAQISDLHVGPHSSRPYLARVAHAVRSANPDLIAVTGDLVDDHAGDVTIYAGVFGALAAPLGVYVVPGNHDVYAGWAKVRAALERLPLTVLVNRAVIVEREGDQIAIAGTGDPAGRHSGDGAGPDVDAALARVPAGTFVVALAHNPALWPALAARGVALTLSGHTHWGQLALPALGWSLASPFLEHALGMYERGRSTLYIHPGTGFWGIPFRLGALPQVAVIELRTDP
ncbi:MAG: metallophosphoesterase [Gemmatimonadaceae bacterium]